MEAAKAADLRRRNRSEKHQNFSAGVPAGQVRGKCRITSCHFTSFSCTEDLYPEASSRVNIRSESERVGDFALASFDETFPARSVVFLRVATGAHSEAPQLCPNSLISAACS